MASPLTRAQRAWLKELGSLVEGTSEDVAVVEDDAQGQGGDDAVRAKNLRDGAPVTAAAFSPSLLDLAPVILNEIQKLGGGRRICAIRVVNKTQRKIFRGNAKHEGGSFKNLPPDSIDPGKQADFMAASPEPLPVLNVPPEGCIGRMDWLLDGELNWFIEWRNPVAGSVKSDTGLTDTGAASRFTPDKINTGGNTAEFRFTIFELGGPNPNPNPNPNPQPGPVDVIASSCLIQVLNKTTQKLTVKAAKHDRGDFMVRPKSTIDPGDGDDAIVSIETPRAPDDGCKGFIEYAIGEPSIGTWRIEWDNPEGQKNTADAPISPASQTLDSLAVIGQGDENVRVNFTLRETGGGDPTPPTPEDPFVPPVESKQPTLRKGDSSADGWVEFAQKLLNDAVKAGLPVDGNFDGAMLAAVKKFQTKNKLLVDGVIGNQTWAALRQGTPEKPSTDGRDPHTFVEGGPEARWVFESDDNNRYFASTDFFRLLVESVGDTALDPATEATIRVTAPGAAPKLVKAKLLPRQEGSTHRVEVKKFRKIFPSVPPDAPVTQYRVEAFLPQELGGDKYSANVKEGAG